MLVARHHGVELSVEHLKHQYSLDGEPDTALQTRMALENSFQARSVKTTWQDLVARRDALPVICRLKNGNSVVLAGFKGMGLEAKALVIDPLASRAELLEIDEETFTAAWDRSALFLKFSPSNNDINEPFGFSWFWPEIVKHQRVFFEIIVSALILHLLALSVPIFFQITFDKVFSSGSISTLYVLTVGVVVALVFNQVLDFIKGWMLLHVSSKLDVKTGTKTFRKLISLPIDFFKNAPAGVLTKHMQQIAVIREFLTGRLFSCVLDITVLLVYVPVLMLYSPFLTSLVLLFSLLIGSVSLAVLRPYGSRLKALYKAEGDRQALLVESISGMETIKGLGLEPSKQKIWDQATANSVANNISVRKVSLASSAVAGFLQKLLSVVIIFAGVQLVFSGELSIGALIAFNMLAARVVGPIVTAIGLVSEFQQAFLSISMLGSIMNKRSEMKNHAGLVPSIKGAISFHNAMFRYDKQGAMALEGVSFNVAAGQVVGIVGRSGSGKSTITRLLQGMYSAESGLIRIDGVDMRELDLTHLRLNMGVVLQETFLFKGTVRANIAASKPDASFARVVEVAQISGAHEFIEQLSHGYETELQEGAANLSGGQKQRLSIARALLRDPRILIFDEATSALDPESEAVIMDNMPRIVGDRTVFIVSHRLASLVNADLILVVDKGKVVAEGTHAEVYRSSSVYKHLWDTQNRHIGSVPAPQNESA